MALIYNNIMLGLRRAALACAGGLLSLFLAGPAAAGDEELREELQYIDVLQQLRMPDIAGEVIAEAKKRFPEAAGQLKVRETQGLLWQGRFEDVKKAVDAIADKNGAEYWGLKLALADAYYTYGKYGDADKLYLEFFRKVDKPSPALAPFYRDSAYKYAQMLLFLGREREALDAYRRVFKVPLAEDVARNVNADLAELMLKLAAGTQKKEEREALLKEAEGVVDKLLWKQDVWFGKAIVMKAHIFLLRSDVKGAQELVENYMTQLKTIHDSLREQDRDGSQGLLRMSPMPQCRYMLAVLLMDEAMAEAKKEGGSDDRVKDLLLGEKDPQTKQRRGDGAFNHFINVFIRFPESQWASEAGERSEAIRKFIRERYGTELKTPVSAEQMAKVRQIQFAGARLVFIQGQFKDAADKYLLVLNQFPESPESVAALGDLAIAYAELSAKDPDAMLMADTVAGHLAERFSGNAKLAKEAGDQLRRVGERYGELKMEDKKREAYELFFRNYPSHYAAGQLVMSFGERDFQAKNYAGARAYYRQIAEVYTNSPYYFDALSRIAQVCREEKDWPGEVRALEFYIGRLSQKERPGPALAAGKFRLADAQRECGLERIRAAATNESAEALQAAQAEASAWFARAAAGFGDVAQALAAAPAARQAGDEEKKRGEQMKEAATFTKALCLAQIQHPKEQLPALRRAAAAAFEDYVRQYPKGRLAPRAQLQIGTLCTILQDAAGAQAAFEKLGKAYPDSEEAKNSVPLLAASLIEMGLRGEGVAKYRQMFAAGGTYTEGQFMAAAKALEEAREFELAFQAYDRALATAKDLAVVATAKLGRARALAGQKKYAEARKLLDAFIKDKELSRLILAVDANLLLADVASEEGRTEPDDIARTRLFNAAVDAVRMVKRYRTEEEQQRELDLMAGQVLVRKMQAEVRLGLKEKAAETRGTAIVAFLSVISAIDPGNAKLAPVLEKAYFSCVPLMLEHKKYKDAAEECENYLRMFPEGQYKTDVQNWLNQARIGQ